MSYTYVSTFSKNKRNEVENYLKENSKAIQVELLSENIIVFNTSKDISQISSIPNLNSLFILIKRFDQLTGSYFKPMFQWSERHSFEILGGISKSFGFKTFRGIISEGDRIISGHRNAIRSLERKVSKQTGLRIDRVSPDTEVWVTHTKDGYGLIMCKISTQKSERKVVI